MKFYITKQAAADFNKSTL